MTHENINEKRLVLVTQIMQEYRADIIKDHKTTRKELDRVDMILTDIQTLGNLALDTAERVDSLEDTVADHGVVIEAHDGRIQATEEFMRKYEELHGENESD